MGVLVRLEGVTIELRPEDVGDYLALHPEAVIVRKMVRPSRDKMMRAAENKRA